MTLIPSIDGASWLRRDIVQAVVAALGQDEIRFVGGAVRDTLVDRPVVDIDAATRHRPEQTMTLLKAAGIKVVPTGLKHGTVTAVGEEGHIEITTLRHDVSTDGRHADVAFTDDWRADAARRDFTMNALYADAHGTLFDPFGGLADLEAGHVRFIGDPAARIREDVLRILRFFRFHAWYGKGAPDPAGLAACATHAGLIRTLSAERVRSELLKLLAAPDPVPAVRAMLATGVAAELPGPPSDADALAHIVAQEVRHGLPADPLLRFAALAAVSPADVRALGRALRLSGTEEADLADVVKGLGAERIGDRRTLRVFIYRAGRKAALARLLADGADGGLVAYAQEWPVPVLPVRGGDLVAQGVPPGPKITQLLRALETEWVENDFKGDRKQFLSETVTLILRPGKFS